MSRGSSSRSRAVTQRAPSAQLRRRGGSGGFVVDTAPHGPRAGGLADQVVALADVRGATGGARVRRAGGGQVAAELVQVAADGVPPVAVAEHIAQPIGLAQ